ncbi:MAG: hypothetical protein JWO77_3394 [Ilumatobacteraceae bacterium]|nr:hypothetical protein [Ilumatobacteraceae bacterium]
MAEIHVLEKGDSWEVWKEGDSMPLGTYPTEGEAVAHAEAAAADAGPQATVVGHDAAGLREDPVTGSTPTDPSAAASGPMDSGMDGAAPSG